MGLCVDSSCVFRLIPLKTPQVMVLEPKEFILVVEDHPDIAELIELNLRKEGYNVVVAPDGQEALKCLQDALPQMILLDIMLPKMNGFEVAKAVRAKKQTEKIPIIMLTARGDEKDIVAGLEAGADDYVVKPIQFKELKARMRAVFRRYQPDKEAPRKQIQVQGLHIDEDKHEVVVDGEVLELTLTEYQTLVTLLKGVGRIFTRDQLIDKVRGHQVSIIDRNIDVHISSLRKKIKEYGKRIVTVRGVGYRFDRE